MEKAARRRYTLKYKREAVRLVASGQKVAAAAKALGIVEQTLANWVKADKAGQLRGLNSEQASAKRMENIRLRAELARVTRERDILHPANEDLFAGAPVREKPRRTSRRRSDELRLDQEEQAALAGMRAVPCPERERFGISSASGAAEEDSQPPPSGRDSLAGRDPRGLRRGSRGLRMAPHVAATEGQRSARGQAGVPGDRYSSLGWSMPAAAIRTFSPAMKSGLP